MARTDLNALNVFATPFTELHVTRAAARLGVTQPAVSHALCSLRDRFDDELFERTAKGLRPTHRALQLAPRIFEAVQAAEDVFRLQPGALSLQRLAALVPSPRLHLISLVSA